MAFLYADKSKVKKQRSLCRRNKFLKCCKIQKNRRLIHDFSSIRFSSRTSILLYNINRGGTRESLTCFAHFLSTTIFKCPRTQRWLSPRIVVSPAITGIPNVNIWSAFTRQSVDVYSIVACCLNIFQAIPKGLRIFFGKWRGRRGRRLARPLPWKRKFARSMGSRNANIIRGARRGVVEVFNLTRANRLNLHRYGAPLRGGRRAGF